MFGDDNVKYYEHYIASGKAEEEQRHKNCIARIRKPPALPHGAGGFLYLSYCKSPRIPGQSASSCRMATKQQSRYILFTAATMVPRSRRFSSSASGSRPQMVLLAPKM